jgi:DNA modification methylase
MDEPAEQAPRNYIRVFPAPGSTETANIRSVTPSHLFYGDNLDVLRESIPSGSVDLVYLDPPFNSNRNYNVIFAHNDRVADSNQAQIQAFDDTWRWSPATDDQYREILSGSLPNRVTDVLRALHALLGENDALAYLVNMAPRLVELHRVLKRTGSLYLHCDPTMSHYLKVLLDAIFGAENFRNEIVWQRVAAKGGQMNRLPANHDIILNYIRSSDAEWHEIRLPYNLEDLDEKTLSKYTYSEGGRRYRLGPLLHPEQGKRPNLEYELMGVTRTWRWSKDRMKAAVAAGLVIQTKPGSVPQQKMYLDDQPGRLVGDVWADINVLNSQASERLGYPTQKPLALLSRIISASTNPDSVVMDPFCGCGTTIDAAQRLGRPWIGIDITYIAVDLIRKRLQHTYGNEVNATYTVSGIPRDLGAARNLFERSPFDFERWAVSLVNGTPNQKQVGDRGIDGVVRFHTDANGQTGRVLVSVKGGKTVGPQFVRDLIGTVQTERAEMGSLLTLAEPTRGIRDAVAHAGTYHWPLNGSSFPLAQVLTVAELLNGRRLLAPPPLLPYIPAGRHNVPYDQLSLI